MIIEIKPKLFTKEFKKWLLIKLHQDIHTELKRQEKELLKELNYWKPKYTYHINTDRWIK